MSHFNFQFSPHRGLQETQDETPPELNGVNSPIELLPTEILSLILQYACPPLDFCKQHDIQNPLTRSLERQPKRKRRFQFALAAVSACWRQVAFSTSQLWTSLDISVESNTVHRASEILQTFFAGSGELPIAIALHFLDDPEQKSAVILPSFLQHTHRIQELHLNNPPGVWTDVLSAPHDSLFHISITNPRTSNDHLWLNAPCSHLTLREISKWIWPRWPTITVLHLFELREDICLELLKECVNLVEYRNKAPKSNLTIIDPPLPTCPFILPYLKTFEWSLYLESRVDQAMLRNARMPALETLVWLEENDRGLDEDSDDEDLDNLSDPRNVFFACLPSTLRALHLGRVESGFGYPGAVRNLGRTELNNIEHLVIPCCHDSSFNPLVQALTINEERETLPKLVIITLHIRMTLFPPISRVAADLNALLCMVESRLAYRSRTDLQQSMRLEIKVHSSRVDWPIALKEKMKSLVQRGLKLEITGDSTLIE